MAKLQRALDIKFDFTIEGKEVDRSDIVDESEDIDQTPTIVDKTLYKKKINIAKTETETDEIWNGRYEFYLTDADDEPDLTKWETNIMYLLK